MITSAEYSSELNLIREAGQIYQIAVKAYRAKEIDDETYLAARKVYLDAGERYDIAFTQAAEAGGV